MKKTLAVVAGLMLATPALACPYADGQAYNAAAAQVDEAEGTKLVLAVEGLGGHGCAAKLVKAVEGLDGVNAVAVNYQTGEAKVAFVDGTTDQDAILKAIQEAGYTAKVATAA